MTDHPSPDPIDVAIGARIRIRRHQLDLSQIDLAGMIGMSFQQLQRFERGTNRISTSTLVRLAGQLATTVAWLVGEEETQPVGIPALASLAQKDAPPLLAAYASLQHADDRDLVLRLAARLAARAAPPTTS